MSNFDGPAAPTGAPVHYLNAAGICRAATVTEIHDLGDPKGRRDLRIHHRAEMAERTAVPFGERGETQTWHALDLTVEPGCRYL